MYKIIGADQKQYGPISGDQIRQWIAEGRVNGQTVACAEGTTDWKPIAEFPEFGFTAAPTLSAAPSASPGPMTREEIIARDYSLDLMSCFSRGWALLKDNFGTMVVAFLLYFVLTIAAGIAVQVIFGMLGVNRLPYATKQYLGTVYIIFNTLVAGPALGGLFYVYISLMRGKMVSVGGLFEGFKSFQDLFLGKLIPAFALTLCWLPFTIASASKMGPIFDRLQENPQGMNPHEFLSQLSSALTPSLPIIFVSLIPAMYLTINWQFTLLLIVDKQMGFWTAMRTSWKMVHKHWFLIFGLLVLVGLLNLAGFLVCCIGGIVTIPLGMAALCYAYEDIFGRQNA
jgi:hypothetical protein